MSRTTLHVNGRQRTVEADDDCPLLYVLRDQLSLDNPRFGCGLGQCGACSVLVDNQVVRSCQLPVSKAAGRQIVTIEGLGTPEAPHPVQQAFIDEQAAQCGYCLNGWMLTAKVLADRTPRPTEQEIRAACEGLVCRCGSHVGLLAAIRRAVGLTRSA